MYMITAVAISILIVLFLVSLVRSRLKVQRQLDTALEKYEQMSNEALRRNIKIEQYHEAEVKLAQYSRYLKEGKNPNDY